MALVLGAILPFIGYKLIFEIDTKFIAIVISTILVLTLLEFQFSKNKTESKKYFYVNDSMLVRKFVFILFLIVASLIFYFSSEFFALLVLCLASIVVSEFVLVIVKLISKDFYISIDTDFLTVHSTKNIRIYASDIKEVEYRYDSFYIQLKGGKNNLIDTKKINKTELELFITSMKNFIMLNNLTINEESKLNLKF